MPLFASKQKVKTYECHFCLKITTSPMPYKTGWICPDPVCGQYNGFTADGNYDVNIISEFGQPSTKQNKQHCRASNIPFNVIDNVFCGSTEQFNGNEFIKLPNGAPLCNKCTNNLNFIQNKLREFDPGENSNYSSFQQYKSLLNKQYPVPCNHCKQQCRYKMQVINHKLSRILFYHYYFATNNKHNLSN